MRPIPVAFHIGPLVVHTYGIGLAIAFWFAYRYLEHRVAARGYPSRWVFPVFIWTVVAAVVGARAMHVLANLSYYSNAPGQVFDIWHGGLSSWGGIILAVPVALAMIKRRCPELHVGHAFDLAVPVLACAWGIGRLLGPQLMVAGGGHPTHQWFGMYYADQVGRRLPVPIFQAAEDFFIFGVLIFVERRLMGVGRAHASDAPPTTRPPAGLVASTGMVLWGVARVVDEKLWLSYPGHLGDVLVEAAGLALAIAGVVIFVRALRRWRAWEHDLALGGAQLLGALPGPPRLGPSENVPAHAAARTGGRSVAPDAEGDVLGSDGRTLKREAGGVADGREHGGP